LGRKRFKSKRKDLDSEESDFEEEDSDPAGGDSDSDSEKSFTLKINIFHLKHLLKKTQTMVQTPNLGRDRANKLFFSKTAEIWCFRLVFVWMFVHRPFTAKHTLKNCCCVSVFGVFPRAQAKKTTQQERKS
jgi:hypothetical protein